MTGDICCSCGEGRVISDPDTGFLVCRLCGCVHDFDVYQHQSFAADGTPIGSLHSAGDFGYRERKLYRARASISDLTSRLGLSAPRAADVARLATRATDGDLGSGDWFPVLVAACAVIVMRQHNSPLPLSKAAAAVARDPRDLGRMVARVVGHLGLGQLPELDAVRVLERFVRSFPTFSALEKEKFDEILGQGRFLLHCSMRWFLTTGRHPLPVISAVLAFVAKVNGIQVGMEVISREIRAGISTSRTRLKELMEVLVRVAKTLLPWGDDVTMKNIVQNAPALIRFMELKSKSKSSRIDDDGAYLQDIGLNLDGILNAYSDYADVVQEESGYFRLHKEDAGDPRLDQEEIKRLKLSADGIYHSHSYKSVQDRLPEISTAGEIENRDGNKRKRIGFEIEDWVESWQGRWESEKGLTPEQVLQRCEGYDAVPPSFIKGLDMRRRRRLKIEAANRRILETMKRGPYMTEVAPSNGEDDCFLNQLPSRKRSVGVIDDLDWEDCIIELLLLHQVHAEEIEQGHYNRLLDLHVFSSPDVSAFNMKGNSNSLSPETRPSDAT